jgi:hypothetical protein
MSALAELRSLFRLRILQLLALVYFLVHMVAIAFRIKGAVRDPDVWWHLKVGEWIVEHHAVPYSGIFSRTAGAHPWIAYSWGYEVLLSRAYKWFGLGGFASFGIVMTILVAFTLFWMLNRLCGEFWFAWAIAFLASLSYLFTLMPRPVYFSMILYTVELTLLLEAQRQRRIQTLYWMPLIFMLWANMHIQFIYGLCVLGMFTGINLLQRLASKIGFELPVLTSSTLPLPGLFAVLAGSFMATFVGPYGYHLYQVVATYSSSQVPYFMIQELEAFSFNSFAHYLLLLLTCAAFFALGSRGRLDPFKISLLVVASMIAFRTQRDAWFLAIAAALFIADGRSSGEKPSPVLKVPELLGVGAAVAIMALLIAGDFGFSQRQLDDAISHEYPVNAANFLRRNPLPGPLYNNLDWGGFLIWYLPQYPVSVDGRNDLYGDEMDFRAFRTENGDEYKADPYLNEAGVVMAPRDKPLAKLLAVDSRFRLIYQDRLSVIFVRNEPGRITGTAD